MNKFITLPLREVNKFISSTLVKLIALFEMSKVDMADEQFTGLDEMNISKLKVPDLKRELKARGLNISGNKMELVQRLSDAVQSGKHDGDQDHASSESVEDDLIDEDDVLNDDEIEQEVENISTIELDSANRSFEVETTEPKISKTLKRKISTPQVPKDEKTARKIVLNRNLSTEIETKSDFENSTTTECSTTNGNGTLTEKKVIKLSELSAKERLEMRAKKFGVPLSGDAKKEVRAQRFGQPGQTPVAVTSTKATITFGKISAIPETQSLDLLKKRAERFGTVSTTLKNVESVEKLEKRKARFGNGTSVPTVASSEDQKAKRLERFKPTLK